MPVIRREALRVLKQSARPGRLSRAALPLSANILPQRAFRPLPNRHPMEAVMKIHTTLEKAITVVHEASAGHYDEIIPVQDMRFDHLERMTIAGQPFEVLPSAQRLLANRLRVPYSYLARCSQDLQQANLQYWLDQESRRRETFFCRFDGSNLRAVFTERYKATDHLEVLSQMLEYGFDPGGEVRFALDQEAMILQVPDPGRAFGLSENDRIVPGISIANSEVGVLALSIEAFLLRLVCSNGLVEKTEVDARYKHISRKAIEEFPRVLYSVVSQSQSARNRFMVSQQTPVTDPEASIERFARQFQLTREEAEVVKQAYHQEQGATMFHIINAFTRAGQDPALSSTDAYRLEKAGGYLLSMVKA